jgi:hypothetical protein
MSSISPFGSNSEALYAATLTSAPAASKTSTGSGSNTAATALQDLIPQDTVKLTSPEAREVFQLGRVAYQQQAGNLTSAQATLLDSQIQQLQTAVQSEETGNGGTLSSDQAQNISQLQDGLSHEIFADAHDLSNGSNQIEPPAVPTP